ncbi:MAG: D-alanine--D-alanine ligase [Candidatus Omnitrophica bacterium]|nr:D-alanine--D-alanine ligase [Candidatus Omnitrophota bacterium]
MADEKNRFTKMAEELKEFRIAILAGGPSSEREVSLKSGRAVEAALLRCGFYPVFIDIKDESFDFLVERDFDIAFLALHGRFGEDGTVQKKLSGLGIPYTGSDDISSRKALDKLAAKEQFMKDNIDTPGHVVIEDFDRDISRVIKYPCVVKPVSEGSSIGLSVVFTGNDIRKAVKTALDYSDKVMVEDYVPGKELTVGVLENRPLPVIEIRAEGGIYDYNAKYMSKETRYIVPAEISKELSERASEIGLRAHMSLGCDGFSRVDLRLDEHNRIFVLEVNTIPGLTSRSLLPMAAKQAGIEFDELCLVILYSALKKRGK